MKNEFIYPLRIHFEDTDCTGFVYHSRYINFMERARSEWFEGLGLSAQVVGELGVYYVIHSLSIEYLIPAILHQNVEVVSVIKSIGGASMDFDQHLRLAESPDKILCKAEVKVVCIDANRRPCRIPQLPVLDEIRRAIT